MRYRNKILSKKERKRFLHTIIDEKGLSTSFTLLAEEIVKIKSLSKPSHRFGYALQLTYLKNKRIDIRDNYEKIPYSIIKFLEEQLGISSENLSNYWDKRSVTSRYYHQLREECGYHKFQYTDEIKKCFYKIAFSHGDNETVVKKAFKVLKNKKNVPPPLATIEHLLWFEAKESSDSIFRKIRSNIQDPFKLYSLLDLEETGTSTFSRIKNTTVNPNSNGVKTLLKAIKELDTYGISLDLSFLSEEKQQYFYLEVQRSDKYRLDSFLDKNKKLSYLAMFIHFRRKEFVDMVIEVTSSYTQKVLKRSRKKSKLYNLKNQEQLKINTLKLKEVIKDVLELNDMHELKKLQDSLIPFNDELESQKEELEEIDFLLKSQSSLNYTNELIETIEFDSNTKPEFIKKFKELPSLKYKREIEIDISIFSKQWQDNIKKMGFSKKSIELALLYSFKDHVRSGDIFVKDSKKYKSLDSYLIEEKSTPPSEEVANKFIDSLRLILIVPKALNFETEIKADEKSTFSDRVYSYFPKISMPEVLYEVNTWTGFLDYIRESDDTYEKQKHLIATLMSNGHNIGFSKMSISSSISEMTLRRIDEFYFNNEALSKSQKLLVNYHHSLDIVKNWGEGHSSSSDGMRVPISSKTIYADYNAHYQNKGGSIYRHINDQYTPYYVQMLEGRDSNHVLDGLLYHGTELQIYEHSTDTAGYTEQMFALTHLLGFEFKPRIKNISQQQLYSFENIEISEKKFKKINEKVIVENYNEILRLVESIKCGKVKASLILNKINSYNRNNGLAKGLREIGRLIKTKYILEYFSDEALRKEVQKMLNKGESINSVARLMFFGKHGRLNESSIREQLEKASSLNILLSSLIIWNTRYLEKVHSAIKDYEWFNEEEFKKVSPLGTSHINFLGKYVFEESNILTEDGLREINI